ncbi:MAG: hypothetical protein KDC44_22510, partial [Phaeodactylibacter sp.]|nr:hypothetical protein [Phaeodactylibacter sp.]
MHAADLELFNTIAQSLFQAEQNEPVIRPIPAEDLHQALDLELPDAPSTPEQYAQALQQLILQTPRTTTRGFFNQLFGGRQSKAVIGDLLAALLNNSMYTYKVAGPMVGVEKTLLRKVSNLVGYGATAGG